MSPGLRLLLAVAVPLVGAFGCYLLPQRAVGWARLLALVTVGLAGGLLISDAGPVVPSGRVERSLGDLVPGVALLARLDPAGLAVGLLACGAAAVALAEGGRRPLERSALLLCLAGSLTCATAGNAVLLFGGLELGNIGTLILAAAGSPWLRFTDRAAFALQHGSALGLLAAAIQMQVTFQTSDLGSVPLAAAGAGIAGPWALAGAIRLVAPVGLPSRPGRSASSAWAAVAAAPSGLLVLIRLVEVSNGHITREVSGGLIAAGLVVALGAAALALIDRHQPAACGRALCLALAGPIMVLAGEGSSAALAGVGAAGLALVLALAAAPAWGAGGGEGAGDGARWLRALALASAGGLPLGYGTAALLQASAAPAAAGPPGSAIAAVLAMAGVGAAVAAVLAAATVLGVPAPPGEGSRIRVDAAAACAVSFIAGVVPGLTLTTFVNQVASMGGGGVVVGIDAGATQGPGGSWSGGYLLVAGLLVAGAALAASTLAGAAFPASRRAALEGAASAAVDEAPVAEDRWRERAIRVLPLVVRRIDGGLAMADGWLAGQPGLLLVVAGAVACLFVFR